MTATETLVAVDFDGDDLPIEPVIAYLLDAGADPQVETGTEPHWRTGAPQTVHRLAYDGTAARSTHVHGVGFRAGFIVHCEPGDTRRRSTA